MWQQWRNRLNHDWLKNTFSISLGALWNDASFLKQSNLGLNEKCASTLREWMGKRSEIRNLIEAFRDEESPRVLFTLPPLANCDDETKSWLPDFIHQHWLTSYPVDAWIEDALTAWREADNCAGMLASALGHRESDADVIAVLVNDFRQAVSVLSDAISCFPSRQLI